MLFAVQSDGRGLQGSCSHNLHVTQAYISLPSLTTHPSPPNSIHPQAILRPLVAPLQGEQLRRLLETVRDWNTHARSCHAAAALLRVVLCSHAPDTLCALPGVAGIIEALVPYTQRHAARLDRLARSAFLLDHVLDTMSMLEPVDEAAQNRHATSNGVLAG